MTNRKILVVNKYPTKTNIKNKNDKESDKKIHYIN